MRFDFKIFNIVWKYIDAYFSTKMLIEVKILSKYEWKSGNLILDYGQ